MLAGIVPFNSLEDAKTRLNMPENGPEKREFVMVMLENVITAALHSMLDSVYLVSRDDGLLARYGPLGVRGVREPGKIGPDAAVALANSRALSEGANATLVLFSDLPILTTHDVDGIISRGLSKDRCVVASPSIRGGTNALWRSPPEIIPTRYGENSFIVHRRESERTGVPFFEFHSEGTSLDVDTYDDFRLLLGKARNSGQNSIIWELLDNRS
jgi:2-phospho-L-lactate guanylyltransferase